MSEKTNGVTYDTEQILGRLGERIKKARLRRNISVRLLEEQAGIGRCTILRIERGVPTVSIGAYMAVLSALGLEKDLNRIALDEEGKWRYGGELIPRERARKKREDGGKET